MKVNLIIFVAVLFSIILAACNNPSSKIEPTATFTTAQCQALFQKTAELFEKADAEKIYFDPNIADALIEASEMFLNNCTDSSLPLAVQTDQLTELAQYSQVIPLSKEYCSHYSPTTQLIDVDGNSVDELILHAQPFNCAGDSGGLSIIFFRDDVIGKWKGQIIWPIPYFVSEEDKDRAANYVWQYHPEPKVQMLNIVDSKGRTFMAVSGSYNAASWSMDMVTILRWDGDQKQIVLETGLDDLCGQPYDFEIGEDYIFLPGAEATDECGARKPKTYVFQDDEFGDPAKLSREEVFEILAEGRKYRHKANLSEADLRDIDLRWVNLSGTDLTKTNFEGADVSGASFAFTFMNEANLNGATLQYADFHTANLQEAGLRKADLRQADFTNALLWKTDMSGADLREAILNDASLEEATLIDADLSGADLRNASLESAKLKGANLVGAIYNDSTIWPEYFDPAQSGAIYEK